MTFDTDTMQIVSDPTDRAQFLIDRVVRAIQAVLIEEEVTPDELYGAMRFLDTVGAAGEFHMFGDTLGLSVIADANGAPAVEGATPSNVEGPLYREDPPVLEPPYLLGDDPDGDSLLVSGTVTDATTGQPLPGAAVDIWQTNHEGLYEDVDPDQPDYNFRGVVHTDDRGRYEVRTVVPVAYQIPDDGPVGAFLDFVGRHAWRPSHLHYKVSADGHAPLTTLLYFANQPYIDDDCIFSVKDSLVAQLHKTGDGPDSTDYEATFDIALAPA